MQINGIFQVFLEFCWFRHCRGIPTENRLIITSGRISSEMVLKAGRMAVPLLTSRTTPTDQAVVLAERMGVTVVGYVRGTRMSVYSHPHRIKDYPPG